MVTNLRQKPEAVYRIYTGRGDAESRPKELKHDLAMGRTSCSRFLANHMRVLSTAGAHVLMQESRLRARNTDCERSQGSTLRDRLLEVAAWAGVSVRRVVVHLPLDFPGRHTWIRVATRSGALALEGERFV